MFTPVPKQNFNVYVKFKTNDKDADWEDLFYTLNSEHRANRFKGNEAVLLALSNSLRYYATTANETNLMLSVNETNVNYAVLKKIVINYLKHRHNEDINSLQLIIGVHDLERNFDYYHYYKLND